MTIYQDRSTCGDSYYFIVTNDKKVYTLKAPGNQSTEVFNSNITVGGDALIYEELE